MSIELVIKIKDDSITLTEKHLLYEPIVLSKDDKILCGLVSDLMGKFNPKPQDPDIIIKATYLM